MPRVIPAFQQFFDGVGDPLVGGKLKFTLSGTNATDKNTYADVSESIPNTNPVLLDSEGRAPNIFGTGSYRSTLFDSLDQQIAQFDPIPGGEVAAGQWGDWAAVIVYPIEFLVRGSDNKIYESLHNNNEGNDPLTSPAAWKEVKFIDVYNANVAYVTGAMMLYTDNIVYVAAADTLSGETPATTPEKWDRNLSEAESDLGTLVGGTQDLDLSKAYVFKCTISTAAQAFTLSNVPAGEVKFEMRITNGGSQTVTFFAGKTVLYRSGVAPTLTAAGLDRLEFSTNDQGTTIEIYPAGINMKVV